jgi:hypothetical protein
MEMTAVAYAPQPAGPLAHQSQGGPQLFDQLPPSHQAAFHFNTMLNITHWKWLLRKWLLRIKRAGGHWLDIVASPCSELDFTHLGCVGQ